MYNLKSKGITENKVKYAHEIHIIEKGEPNIPLFFTFKKVTNLSRTKEGADFFYSKKNI